MKNKKAVAVILALALIIGSFAFGLFNASAKTQAIILDTEIINTTDGTYDKNWYYFTPEQTGIYTFLSYNNVLYAEAYLFSFGDKEFTQLAYSNSSPNWEYYGQPNKYQICLSYRLEAGKTYYYAAGWNSERTKGTLTVKLIYEGSDEDVIDSIDVECNADLTWYTDGTWETDASGEKYFNYNYSKILRNMIVILNYKNGQSVRSAVGESTVDGYTISFIQNQSENHWYPQADEKYTHNTLTVKILNKTKDYDVVINQSALFTVYGSVCDYIGGEAISDAVISINGNETATTDADGNFSFVSAPGVFRATVSGSNIIKRDFTIVVEIDRDANDHSDNPIGVVACDYVSDGIINAKDFAYIQKNFTGESKRAQANKFSQLINFKAENYEKLSI